MATARDVVKAALQYLLKQEAEQPIESADLELCITVLNDMMTSKAGGGINIGFTIIVDADDTVTVSDTYLGYVKTQLALASAPMFDIIPNVFLTTLAAGFEDDLLVTVIGKVNVEYSDTLPTGAGNDQYYSRRFFRNSDASILTENDGNIILDGNE